MSKRITHVGFADESHWNTGRFRALALISTQAHFVDSLTDQLLCLLRNEGMHEFKWINLAGAKERAVAETFCELVVDWAIRRQLRVDVLIWDINDSRHSIRGRDDVANLQRMYYHLFRNVLRARWPSDAHWALHPDEHTAMDWETARDCLIASSLRLDREPTLYSYDKFRVRLRSEFGIALIEPLSSEHHPALQLADLFAGMAVFSRANFEEYRGWLPAAVGQMPLLEPCDARPKPSRTSRERLGLLKRFDQLCRERKLGVSLCSSRGLRTRDPARPINFWLYEPQHPGDKAPQRTKRSP